MFVGVCVAVLEGLTVGVEVSLGSDDGVSVGTTARLLSKGTGVSVTVLVKVSVGVEVAVLVEVSVGVNVEVLVAVLVEVAVAVLLAVSVGSGVNVAV